MKKSRSSNSGYQAILDVSKELFGLSESSKTNISFKQLEKYLIDPILKDKNQFATEGEYIRAINHDYRYQNFISLTDDTIATVYRIDHWRHNYNIEDSEYRNHIEIYNFNDKPNKMIIVPSAMGLIIDSSKLHEKYTDPRLKEDFSKNYLHHDPKIAEQICLSARHKIVGNTYDEMKQNFGSSLKQKFLNLIKHKNS